MEYGTVKWFSDRRGFGFISRSGGVPDIFVHHSGIAGQRGRRALTDGAAVEFEISENERGIMAVNVSQV